MIDLVFFDAGETLIHPHPSFAELFATLARARGHEVTAADVKNVQDRMAPYLIDQEEEGSPRYTSLSADESRRFWTYLYRRFLEELGVTDEDLVADLYARFSHYSSYKLFDDALPALRELQSRGLRLGLISNFERFLEEMLIELEVGHLFDVTVISGIEGVEKPDPAIYRLALDKASAPPEECVHVGDSVLLDAEPAASVGMRAIVLDRAERLQDLRYPKIASLKELPDLVANL